MQTNPQTVQAELQRRLGEHARRHPPYRPMGRVVCADGFSVSIQASSFSYCTPRGDVGPWDKVELGYPNAPMPSLAGHNEEGDPATVTNTVWAYVPVWKVAQMLAEHGGLVPTEETA